jgi:vesicle coat complex subunit
LLIALLRIKLNLKIIVKFIWHCVVFVVSKFLVMKAENTVVSYNGRDFTSKIATVYFLILILAEFCQKTEENTEKYFLIKEICKEQKI